MTHHHSRWWMMAASGCAVAATVVPAAFASAAGTFVIEMDDVPDKIRLGDEITYEIDVTNNTGHANNLIVLSWEPATFVSFDAPPGWHVNLPPIVTPTAISTFYNADGDVNTADSWSGTVTFTLVVQPSSLGRFDATGTVFHDLPGEDRDSDHERTIVRGPR